MGVLRCVYKLPARGAAEVRFGRHKASVSPLKTRSEPDREEEPEVRSFSAVSETEQGLAKRRVRNRLVGALFSVFLGWGVYQWVVNSWKQEGVCWEGCH